MSDDDLLIRRYQTCASRILGLFPKDPLAPEDPAHTYIERLESVLDHGWLTPTTPPLGVDWRARAEMLEAALKRVTPAQVRDVVRDVAASPDFTAPVALCKHEFEEWEDPEGRPNVAACKHCGKLDDLPQAHADAEAMWQARELQRQMERAKRHEQGSDYWSRRFEEEWRRAEELKKDFEQRIAALRAELEKAKAAWVATTTLGESNAEWNEVVIDLTEANNHLKRSLAERDQLNEALKAELADASARASGVLTLDMKGERVDTFERGEPVHTCFLPTKDGERVTCPPDPSAAKAAPATGLPPTQGPDPEIWLVGYGPWVEPNWYASRENAVSNMAKLGSSLHRYMLVTGDVEPLSPITCSACAQPIPMPKVGETWESNSGAMRARGGVVSRVPKLDPDEPDGHGHVDQTRGGTVAMHMDAVLKGYWRRVHPPRPEPYTRSARMFAKVADSEKAQRERLEKALKKIASVDKCTFVSAHGLRGACACCREHEAIADVALAGKDPE